MVEQQKKYKSLVDIPSIVEEFVQKVTLKRFEKLRPSLQKLAEDETNYLFKYMVDDIGVFGAQANPFSFYTKGHWEPLSPSYAKRKKTTAFWINEERGNLLIDWFASGNPESALGKPYVYMTDFSHFARGWQNVKIDVVMFPKKKMDAPEWVLNRLFGRRYAGEGFSGRISNEEDRPILKPAILQLVNYRFKRRARKLIKEVLENG